MKRRNIRSRDILLPPSMVSAASFGLVARGADHLNTPEGLAKVTVGRLGDIADGFVARHGLPSLKKLADSSPEHPASNWLERYMAWSDKHDTWESDAGAIVDVTLDKLGMALIAKSAWQKEIMPRPLIVAMTGKHLANAAATLVNGLDDKKKRAIRPPKSGKLSMAADNASLFAFSVANLLEQDGGGRKIARGLGYTAALAGMGFGFVATRHYLKNEFDESRANE